MFCLTFITSTSTASATVKWPRNEDSKNGFSFAVGRPEAEIIDILCFNIIWAFSFEATQRSDWSEDIGWKKKDRKDWLRRCVFLQVTRTKRCAINNKLMLTLNWQSCLQRTCLHFTITLMLEKKLTRLTATKSKSKLKKLGVFKILDNLWMNLFIPYTACKRVLEMFSSSLDLKADFLPPDCSRKAYWKPSSVCLWNDPSFGLQFAPKNSS